MLKGRTSKFMFAFLVWTNAFVTRAEATNATLSIEFKQFKDFVLEFRKTYSNAEEQAKRFNIFKSNLKLIDKLNADEEDHAEYGVNKFSDLTPEEFQRKMLVPPLLLNTTSKPQSSRGRWTPKQHSSPKNNTVRAGTTPPCFSWISMEFYPPITTQGACGSCVPFSSAAAMSILYSRAKRRKVLLSVQQMVDCKSDFECATGTAFLPFLSWLTGQKIMLDADYPYEAKKGSCSRAISAKGVVTLAGHSQLLTESDMLGAMKNSPVAVGIDASKFQLYIGGIMSGAGCSGSLSHAVVLVGYAEEVNGNQRTPFWEVRNSWGADWGILGHLKLLRGANQCRVATEGWSVSIKVLK